VIRSHYLPRTRNGWIAVVLFLLLMVLVEPPVVHTLANRIEPWILGVPFLYAYLLVAYCLLIGVLLWAMGRKL
jgi:choline-glycine betaine transporter